MDEQRRLVLIPESALPAHGVFGRDLDLQHYRRYLGESRDHLFYDARAGLRANTFLALAATLRAGKALYLHLPDTSLDPDHQRLLDWGTAPELAAPRFNNRFRRLSQQLPQSALPVATPHTTPAHTLHAHIILGKRGRGKSHYLADKLLWLHRQFPDAGVLVVLPYRNQSALTQTLRHLPTQHLWYLPPDQALHQRPPAQFLIVDEAAAISPEQLLALCQHYPRYTLASTMDGYEGYGQRLQQQILPALLRQQAVQLDTFHHAYRYPAYDALEQQLEQIFLYQHYPAPISNLPSDKALCYQHVNPNILAENEALLRATYALLNLAHYHTNPEDLKRLLDLPHQHLVLAYHGDCVQGDNLLGLVYAVEESALPDELARAVIAGNRRPQGRLLLQQLLIRRQNLNDNHPWLRISRIASHPQMRRRGLATKLLQTLQQHCPLPLGVCYHANNGSDAFWQSFGFKTILQKGLYNCLTNVQILDRPP